MIAEPAWTERTDKRGLDPLGMQNAGVSLYQALLPGISNVTLRMRYYGYYCWVSDAYARNGASDDFSAWRTWVRRSEALYALVSSHAKGQVGVGGIEWADRRLALEEDVIDFAEAASNDSSVTRYLRQSLGVFGGAYYSQMVEVGLFVQGEHGIQRATNTTGIYGADALRKSVGPDVEACLLQAIKTARVKRDDLSALSPIVPSAIPEGSIEREAYERLLFAVSEHSRPGDKSRATSLRLILSTAQEFGGRPSPDDVRHHLFATSFPGDEDLERQRIRWEAYQCQDLFQVAAAALLEWALDLMRETDAGVTLAEIQAEVLARLRLNAGADAEMTWHDLCDGIDQEAFDYAKVWSSLVSRRGTSEQKAVLAVRLMAALDARLLERSELRQTVQIELGVKGNARSVVTELAWLSHRKTQLVQDVISTYVVDRVVRRHNWVAMQKLRRQRDYTFLFELRDGRFFRRNGYAPAPTTPRLVPAVQFLEDIGLIDASGICDLGRTQLMERA